MKIQKMLFLKLRFVMAFIFLWAFVDKVFGLGFATTKGNAWINGGSPTNGFLTHAVKGPFASYFHSLASFPGMDYIFMLGLLFVGMTLLFNKYLRWGSIVGVVMLVLMWLALLFPANNPIIDEHIVYAILLLILAVRSKNGELSF